MNILEQTDPKRRRYGIAAFVGLIAGIVSSFVKWGAEVPLPPRSSFDQFKEACNPEFLLRAAEQVDCSRNFLNPPYIFLRDWLGISDPTKQYIHLQDIFLTGLALLTLYFLSYLQSVIVSYQSDSLKLNSGKVYLQER